MTSTGAKRKDRELVIAPGLWRMRNGHSARVEARLDIPFTDKAGEDKLYPIWNGMCVECQERCTWRIDGHYAVTGDHAFDLVEAI